MRSQAPLLTESPLAGYPGRYVNVRHCGWLSMVLLQLKGPLELFLKRKEFPPGCGFLSRSRLSWSLYKCAALWRAVYGSSATEAPLRTIPEEKGISSRFRVSFSSRYDLSCWKRRKTIHSFLRVRPMCEKLIKITKDNIKVKRIKLCSEKI